MIALKEGLDKALIFVIQCLSAKWYKKAFKASSNEQQLEIINEDLQKTVNLLNLAINAQQIIDMERDKKAVQEDAEQLNEQQEEILKLDRKNS